MTTPPAGACRCKLVNIMPKQRLIISDGMDTSAWIHSPCISLLTAGLEQERVRVLSEHDVQAIMTHTGLCRCWSHVIRSTVCWTVHTCDIHTTLLTFAHTLGCIRLPVKPSNRTVCMQRRFCTGSERARQQHQSAALGQGDSVWWRLHC